MHRGVQEFIRWLTKDPPDPNVALHRPATASDMAALEQQLGGPMPADLRLLLTRFNGGKVPSGTLLSAGVGPGTMEAAVRQLAEHVGADFLDPELPLPFHLSEDGSWLAFDRTAGPVPDTWPIVDYFEDTGETRLVHRTFDGWCSFSVAEWDAPDRAQGFSLDTYLRRGERHVALEPDVASAHATVAHARKRAGQPERALDSYLTAARCVPPLAWCDWEALKLSVLLGRDADALEAATRLCTPIPRAKWKDRETTPAHVADVLAPIAARAVDRSPWVRLVEQLLTQAASDEREHVRALRDALVLGTELPPPVPMNRSLTVPVFEDSEAWWEAARHAYTQGLLRDDDLLLAPSLANVLVSPRCLELLRIRREF